MITCVFLLSPIHELENKNNQNNKNICNTSKLKIIIITKYKKKQNRMINFNLFLLKYFKNKKKLN